MDLALNNLQQLISHKNPTNQPTTLPCWVWSKKADIFTDNTG